MQQLDHPQIKRCLAKCLPEFSEINHFWDSELNIVVAKILPGEFYMTSNHIAITTTLGSCVSACIWDKSRNIGGMNHFMLPFTEKEAHEVNWGQKEKVADASRYGNFAMEHLINAILKNGGIKDNLRAKIFGGGNVTKQSFNIGQKNTDYAYEYLDEEGIKVEGEDVGDVYPRKLIFEPFSGRAYVKNLKIYHTDTIIKREKDYSYNIAHEGVDGDVELF